MSHCCKYLINFSKKNATSQQASSQKIVSPRQQNPQVQLIGPNTEYLQYLGMVPTTFTEPLIKFTSEDVPKCDLQFNMTKAVDFSFDLKLFCCSGDEVSGQGSRQRPD